ncbi:MAG TPA: nuclear transport factor 2 family protein [Advenella sp.]|nr:nuclear transport factor 2 family protein [Advenella sp.]
MKQCENQVMLFFRCLDERRYDALAALLAPDAIWRRQGKALRGPEQVQQALRQRSPTMKIAHIITNLVFDECATEHCAIRCYMLVIRHEPGEPRTGACPLQGIESIRNVQIQMKQVAGNWLIAQLSAEETIFAANA